MSDNAVSEEEYRPRFLALWERYPRDAYDGSSHPLLRAIQDYRPRCPTGCRCVSSRVWLGLAVAIVTHMELEHATPS